MIVFIKIIRHGNIIIVTLEIFLKEKENILDVAEGGISC